MFFQKTITYILDKISPIANSDPLKDFDAKESLRNEIALITKLFKYQGIDLKKINDINIIGGGDYSEEFSKQLETSIINKSYTKNVFEGYFTWNGDHLHLNLVRVDNCDYYITAIWYPFELYANPDILWVYKLDKDEAMFWNNLIKPKS